MIITNLIKNFNTFNEAEVEKICNAFVPISFDAKSLLLNEGEICNKVYYVYEGVLREFSYIDADIDIDTDTDTRTLTHHILAENEWIYQIESFLLEKPSACCIEALSPIKAFYIIKQDLERLVSEIPSLAYVMIKIYEKYLLQLEHRNAFHRIKSAEQRLEVFEKMQPNIQNRVSGKVLASYLNVTPQQLSRIRNKRAHG
jgi:CRP/FNR family transcriptional regulator, anaerobic regulatory protein